MISFCSSPNTPFKGNRYELLCFYGKFHGEFLEHVTAEPIDEECHRIFFRKPALTAIKELII